jgi:O-antigen ligase
MGNKQLVYLSIIHFALGLILYASTFISTLHVIGVSVLGVFFLLKDDRPDRVLYIIGYCIGSEVLWRMTHANIPWMYSEYYVSILTGFSIIKYKSGERGSLVPLMSLLLLLPGMVASFYNSNIEQPWSEISFSIAPYLCFCITSIVLKRITIDSNVIKRMLQWTAFPLIAVSSICAYSIFILHASYAAISESNNAAAGGFGANQVSNVLALGSACFYSLLYLDCESNRQRLIYILLILFPTAMALLTLARGGMLNFTAFLLVSLAFVLKNKKNRRLLIALIIPVFFIYSEYVIPSLDNYTSGAISRRYNDKSTTNRDIMVEAELRAFKENPIFGTGVGGAKIMRGEGSATHTEYTRLLAEHGLLGVLSFGLFCYFFIQQFRKSKIYFMKMFIASSLAWTMASFSHQATRTAAFVGMTMIFALNVRKEQDKLEDSKGEVPLVSSVK